MDVAVQPARYKDVKKSSAGERDRLILEHLPQVRLIARRIHSRVPASVNLDDLASAGVLGLIAAIDRFDSSRNISLKTYAEHKIKGKILDSLRQLDWAPRSQRRHAKQIEAAMVVVEQRLQRAPTEEEIAAELHLSVEKYHEWQFRVSGLTLARLESAGTGDSEERDLLRCISGDRSEWPSAVFERRELQRGLASAISGIPDREKTVLSLYYHEELTLREIAKMMGLHESRISQLRSQAILRLRVCMTRMGHVVAAIGNPQSGKHPAAPLGFLGAQTPMPLCSAPV